MNFKYPLILRKTKAERLMINIYKYRKVIIVSVPHFYSNFQINDFISEKENWIRKKIELIEQAENLIRTESDEIFLLGSTYKLIRVENEMSITTNFKEKTVTGNVDVLKDKSSLKQFYRNISKKYIIPYAFQLSKKHNIEIKRIFIRDQKSSWGTYSTRGNLSFNFRAILCPEPVIRYLVYHELSHTIQMNHSKKFWAQVEAFFPEYEEHKKWLKVHSQSIRAIV